MTRYLVIFVLFSIPSFAQQGLKGEYFAGKNFNRKVFTRTDPQINFDWNHSAPGPGMPNTDYSIRWIGRLQAPVNGDYEFSAQVDDGLRLWVGGIKVIDAWGPHDHEYVSGKVGLKANHIYELRIEYFNGILEGQIKLNWEFPQPPNTPFIERITGRAAIIDRKFFFPPPVPKAEPISVAKPIENQSADVLDEEDNVPISKKAIVESETKKEREKPIVPETKNKSEAVVPPILGPPPVQAANKRTKMMDTIDKYTPKNILFEAGEPFIQPDSYIELNLLVKLLKRFTNLKVQIDGHTDITGDPKINLQLSKDRASEIAYYLKEQGIAEERLKTNGYGSSRPIYAKDSTQKYPENRRVEFKVY